MIIVIGRGHSGTRAVSHTLYASGVYVGNKINDSGDKLPPEQLYEACRVMAPNVRWLGELSWDFSALHTMDIDPRFTTLVQGFLADVLVHAEPRGWKLPETTLVFPWIVRLFPEAHYVYLVRDPRDCVIGGHLTDDLRDFGVNYPLTDDVRERRAISWRYQYELVRSTPLPERFHTLRFEDLVLRQEETVTALEEFLGLKLARIMVRPDSVGRWRQDAGRHYFDFFRAPMLESGYTEGLPPSV